MRRIAHTRKEVMTNAMLFGLYLTPLFNAIAQVESDCGATSENVYQIQDIYLDDLSRIYMRIYPKSIKKDKAASEFAIVDYWKFYAHQYARKTGKPITYLTLAALHHEGPSGCYKIKDTIYYKKIFKELQKQGVESWEGAKCRCDASKKCNDEEKK